MCLDFCQCCHLWVDAGKHLCGGSNLVYTATDLADKNQATIIFSWIPRALWQSVEGPGIQRPSWKMDKASEPQLFTFGISPSAFCHGSEVFKTFVLSVADMHQSSAVAFLKVKLLWLSPWKPQRRSPWVTCWIQGLHIGGLWATSLPWWFRFTADWSAREHGCQGTVHTEWVVIGTVALATWVLFCWMYSLAHRQGILRVNAWCQCHG